MARTRSTAAPKGGKKTTTKSTTTIDTKPSSSSSSSVYTLSPQSTNPPKLFILPKSATPSARILTLQHPRYTKPARYLVCPTAGFFEFTTIAPPSSKTPRSWLIQTTTPNTNTNTNTTQTAAAQPAAEITQSPALYLATPYDPLFLLLPALFSSPSPQQHSQQKRMFLPLDDHLDTLPDLASLLATCPASRERVEARVRAVCDVVQAGGESMYRVNEQKVVAEVWGKAGKVVGEGAGMLPGSLEERFVRRELEAPVLGVRRPVAQGGGGGSGSVTPGGEDSQGSVDSQEGADSQASAVSAASTAATSVGGADDEGEVAGTVAAPAEVVRLLRLRVAFNFICSSCVAPGIAQVLKKKLAESTELVDFKPLDEYLAQLVKMRQEAAAARSSDFSRKRLGEEEEDERAEKRRKMEAEEKAKKANISRGVKNLMKVNTTGMKKMSDFFKKKA